MAGVLVSQKTMAGTPVTNRRYPVRGDISGIVDALAAGGAYVTAHFNSRRDTPLDEQLQDILSVAPGVQGFQLNIRRPDPDAIHRFVARCPDVDIILQVNRSSLSSLEPSAVLEYVQAYGDAPSHALLDLSGGNGTGLDPEWAVGALRAIDDHCRACSVRPGVAGGLGPDAGALLEALVSRTRSEGLLEFSIDAEGRLRRPVVDPIPDEPYQDVLGLDLLHGYLGAAGRLRRSRTPSR
jgi:hypothetical protein